MENSILFLRHPLPEIAQILNPKKLPLTIRVKLMAFDFCHKKQLFDKIMVSGTYYEIHPGLKLVEEKDFVTTFMVNNTSQ